MQPTLQAYSKPHKTREDFTNQDLVKPVPAETGPAYCGHGQQPAAAGGKVAVSSVEDATACNLGRKKILLERNILALSSDLAHASMILANRAGEIVNFASALPASCSQKEAATRISTFIESLYPTSSSFQSGHSFHSGLGEMIASCISVNRVAWTLALTTIGLAGLAAILIAK